MRAFAAALLVIGALPLFAQRVFDDEITVNVVEVPVYVERFGKPVAGLTREDFELFVAGQRQEIEYFDVIDAGRASARPEAEDTADLTRRRLFVLLFDVGGSSAHALELARRSAMQYLASAAAGDTYAVATIGRNGVRFLVPFTNDRLAVQRAVGTLTPSEAADPFRVATSNVERIAWREAMSGSARLDIRSDVMSALGNARGLAPSADVDHLMQRWEQEERYLGDWKMIGDLGHLAESLAPLAGVKHVVLLSERPGLADVARLEPAARMHQRYRDAGVLLDAIDIRAPFVPGITASSSTQLRGEQPSLLPSDFLYSLALDTGGTVSQSLAQLQQSNGLTYVLGFRPKAPRKNDAIRVRVKDRPVLTEVRYRRSFTLGKPDSGDDSLFLADTLLNDIPHRGVSLDLDVNGSSVAAKIPGAELLANPTSQPLPLEVFLYVFDEKGQPVQWQQARLDVNVAAEREFLAANPFTIRRAFRLEPGRYAAKAIVRIPGTDRMGFQRTDFVVR